MVMTSTTVGGKTKSRWLSEDEAAVVQQQLDDGDRFRLDVEAYWQACETLADAALEHVAAETAEGGEIGGESIL